MATAVQSVCVGAPRFSCAAVWGERRGGGASGGRRGVALRPRRRNGVVGVVASAVAPGQTEVGFERGRSDGVRWVGSDPSARLLSWLLSIKPLYKALKVGAKSVMIRSAEKNGIPWQKMVNDLKTSDVYAEKDLLENALVTYPDYYLKEFHGYEKGNLSWEVAFEVEPATMVIMRRTFPSCESPRAAADLLRHRWLEEIETHHAKFADGLQVRSILDVGCSTGTSTRSLRDHFPTADVVGLDLSPYFLAVAQYLERQNTNNQSSGRHIQYVHAKAEETGLPSASFDIISFAFVLHECPRDVVPKFLREARRLLRIGGTISFIDQSPKSKVIQSLSPARFVMMKAVEPWLDEFHMLNLEEELSSSGFTNVTSVLTSPRHFTLTATAI